MERRASLMWIAALVLLALGVGFFLLFAIGETAGGDVSGVQHFPPALVLAGLLALAWRRPFAAGVVLLALTLPFGAAYLALLVARDLPLPWALTVLGPPVVAGILLLRAGRAVR